VIGVDLGVKTSAVFSDGRPARCRIRNIWGRRCGSCAGRAGPCPGVGGPTAGAGRPRRTGGARRTRPVTACTTAPPTCGGRRSISSPPAWPGSTARSWSRISMSLGCCVTAGWRGRSRMPGSVRSAANSPTRPGGVVVGLRSPTGGFPAPRRARTARQ
jgi:hypothetical protein